MPAQEGSVLPIICCDLRPCTKFSTEGWAMLDLPTMPVPEEDDKALVYATSMEESGISVFSSGEVWTSQ